MLTKKGNSIFFIGLSSSSHSHSSRSLHHLRSTMSSNRPSSRRTISEASDDMTRSSQQVNGRNVSQDSHRAFQQPLSPQEQRTGIFCKY